MSSHQTLEQTLLAMTEGLEAIKTDNLDLNQMMAAFLQVTQAYENFQIHVANETLDVKEVKPGAVSSFVESDFEWRNI